MTLAVMLFEQLAKAPETRTSAKGNNYTVATIRTGEGDDAVFASITAFGDLVGTLAGLERGSPITVVGTGKIGTCEAKDGSGTRASLSITASRIVALVDHQTAPRPKPERREDRQQYRQTNERQYHQPVGPREFADEIPF